VKDVVHHTPVGGATQLAQDVRDFRWCGVGGQAVELLLIVDGVAGR